MNNTSVFFYLSLSISFIVSIIDVIRVVGSYTLQCVLFFPRPIILWALLS